MSKRILVVDDERNIRLMLDQALVTAGYEVQTAADGQQALEAVAAGAPDMVLLDMKLPDLHGIDVLQRLRQTNAAVPVAMITAHGSVETAVAALKLGAVDYLRKPFAPDEIRALVDKVLHRQELAVDPPAETAAGILEQAKLLLQQRRFQEAEALLRQAAAKDPADAEVLNLLGVGMELKGHLPEASQFFRAALSFNPGYAPAQQGLHRVTSWPYSATGVAAELAPKAPAAEGA